jgi:hypothetical protein
MGKKFLIITLSLIYFNLSFGQNLQDGQKRWSSENKLSIDDFKIKISDQNNDAVYSWILRIKLRQSFRSHCASDFGSICATLTRM